MIHWIVMICATIESIHKQNIEVNKFIHKGALPCPRDVFLIH